MNNSIVYSTKLVKKLDAKSSCRYWLGHVSQEDNQYHTYQEYWSSKKNGEESIHQCSEPILVVSKNVGRSNQTSEYNQAVSEITSLYNKKIDEGYREEGKEETIFLPMLAQKFDSKKAKFPAYVQPKLDGIRAFRLPNGTFWTRKGKQILVDVVAHLTIESDVILDGELILPPTYTFQETISAVKKNGVNSSKLEYHFYDCYDKDNPNLTFETRYELLFAIARRNENRQIERVLTTYCDSLAKFESYSFDFIEQGYEGSMYRSINGAYKVNYRSSDLLKYKEFVDAEFKIIGVIDGEGREKNCAIFTCVTNECKLFNVRPKATLLDRQEMFENKDFYIGKLYTVKYQELTDDNIPRFPVGISVRDYE